MKILWAAPAVSDLEAVAAFLARDSRSYADRSLARLVEAARPLEAFPEMGRRVSKDGSDDLRELQLESYRMIYRVGADRVEVLGLLIDNRAAKGFGSAWDPAQR